MTWPRICFLCSLVALTLICATGVRIASALSPQGAASSNSHQASLQRTDEKIIGRDLWVDDPVDIGALAVKGVPIELGKKFSAKLITEQSGGLEEDWLENLEITVNNNSDKRITYLQVSLRFPHSENSDSSVGMFYHFVLGVDLRASGQAATLAEPFSLDAGASHTIRLNEKDLKEIKKRLEMTKKPLVEVNKVFIRISVVGYEDGLQWQAGTYIRPEKQRQSDNKVIEKMIYGNEPCEVSELSVKNVKITSIERLVQYGVTKTPRDSYEFSAKAVAQDGGGPEEDWLENLKLTIKNKSDKLITYIGLSIQFPETVVNGPTMVDTSLNLGIHPKAPAEWANRSAPLALLPGDTSTFTLSAKELTSIKNFLASRKFQLAGLNKAVIRMETVILEGGTTWSGGNFFKPSKSAAGGYERIDQ